MSIWILFHLWIWTSLPSSASTAVIDTIRRTLTELRAHLSEILKDFLRYDHQLLACWTQWSPSYRQKAMKQTILTFMEKVLKINALKAQSHADQGALARDGSMLNFAMVTICVWWSMSFVLKSDEIFHSYVYHSWRAPNVPSATSLRSIICERIRLWISVRSHEAILYVAQCSTRLGVIALCISGSCRCAETEDRDWRRS